MTGPRFGEAMAAVEVIEVLAGWSCGAATLLWLLIATVSRQERWERGAQWAVVATSLLSAVLLFLLHGMGGSLWGSRTIARPVAVFAIIMAVVARMNLWGRKVENPDATIQRWRQEAAAEEE